MTKSELANEIVRARKAGEQTMVAMPDPPMNRNDAMDIQQLAFERYGATSVGWKVGAANESAQKAFGIDSPFYGPMAQSSVLESGASLKKTPCVGAVEPEYAFRMSRDFPANGEAVTIETIKDAVESVHLAIEVIGRCMGDTSFANGVGVTMDFGGNAAFVVGPAVDDWRNVDLVSTRVEGLADGAVAQTGSGAAVMGDPLVSLVWMAETLAANGDALKAGDWVSTGTCTPPVPAVAGQTVEARFEGLGSVTVQFT